MKKFRTNGAVGALLDEYEKAIHELINTIDKMPHEQLTKVADPETNDPDCRSIQTVLIHVIKAGHCYIIEVRRSLGEQIDFVERKTLDSIEAYQEALLNMFQANEQLFDDYPNIELETHSNNQKIAVRWGQYYDVEQLMEHAIVHVLRHRRQIERFVEDFN